MAETKQIKDIYKQIDSVSKPKKELDVKNVGSDIPAYTADKEKAEKNKQFINRVKDDIYIDETVKVMNDMIGQNNTAKTN